MEQNSPPRSARQPASLWPCSLLAGEPTRVRELKATRPPARGGAAEGAWTGALGRSPSPRLEAARSSDLRVWFFPGCPRQHHLDQRKTVQGGRNVCHCENSRCCHVSESRSQHRFEALLTQGEGLISISHHSEGLLQEGTCYKWRGEAGGDEGAWLNLARLGRRQMVYVERPSNSLISPANKWFGDTLNHNPVTRASVTDCPTLTLSQDMLYLHIGPQLNRQKNSPLAFAGHAAGPFILFFPSRICQYHHCKHFHDHPNLGSIP